MRGHSTSPAFLRVERDMHVSGLTYEFTWTGQWAPHISFPGRDYSAGLRFDDDMDVEAETHLVADQVQVAVLDVGQVGPARTWPRAEIGGAPLWAAMHDGVAVWEGRDGTERHRIGELPAGR